LQHDVYDGAFGRKGDSDHLTVFGRDNVTELYFADMSALKTMLTDPETKERSLNDGPNYADVPTAVAIFANEVELPVDQSGGGRLKVFHFLRRRDGVDPDSFFGSFKSAFERALISSGSADKVRKATWSAPLPEDTSSEAPAGKDAQGTSIDNAMSARQSYAGYSTFWYDREDTGAVHFRAYADAFMTLSEDLIDHSASFFLLAREQLIFDRG